MNDRVFIVLVILAFVFGLYKCFKEKNGRLFYSLLFCASLLIPRNAFVGLPELRPAIWSFLGFFVVGQKVVYKKWDRSFIVFAVIFLALGIILLLQGCGGTGSV